ncbi:MAG TPA: hypothetical protein VM100_07185 [Longimicrobiales bacterium]|nr:hypothetical protein [Longimicrobiales bacterium]
MVWLVVIIALMIPLIAVLLDSHLGRAIASRLDTTSPRGVDIGESKRLNALEAEIERLNAEVLRLDEETTFLHRLLENKPSQSGELPPGDKQN